MIGCGASVDLATWQKLSGQDKGSRVIDPWAQRDQMPDWFKERFHFAKDQFRQAEQTWETYISGKVRRSVAQIVLYSRLLRTRQSRRRNSPTPTSAVITSTSKASRR